jgi:hypothetical protein
MIVIIVTILIVVIISLTHPWSELLIVPLQLAIVFHIDKPGVINTFSFWVSWTTSVFRLLRSCCKRSFLRWHRSRSSSPGPDVNTRAILLPYTDTQSNVRPDSSTLLTISWSLTCLGTCCLLRDPTWRIAGITKSLISARSTST